ncbi:hypothetical protein ElyMa_006288600, partial [Elysia marginata]
TYFESGFDSARRAATSCHLSIEEVVGDIASPSFANMTRPAKTCLLQQTPHVEVQCSDEYVTGSVA